MSDVGGGGGRAGHSEAQYTMGNGHMGTNMTENIIWLALTS